ncbi:U3 small nucleolar ribonucleoprotein imp4 [Entamoeba marina]
MESKKNTHVKPQARRRSHQETFKKMRQEKMKEKKLRRKLIAAGKVQRQTPITLETKRVRDESFVDFEHDQEAIEDIENDEYSSYYKGREPKTIVTTTILPHVNTKRFASTIAKLFYGAKYFNRGFCNMHKVINYAKRNDYTNIVICNDNHRTCTDLYVIHLPCGPSFHFKVFNILTSKQIKDVVRLNTWKIPCECITSGFQTRLGVMVARQFNSFFSQEPKFRGRRVVTFHSQRDFVFFRHHIYQFKKAKDAHELKNGPVKCIIDELGPRFVLKLRSIQKGIMNTTNPEYIYFRNIDKSNTEDTSRSKFML